MSSTAATIIHPTEMARFFRRYGWHCERLDENTFRTGFRGKNAAFVALVRITEHWVVFTINPFVQSARLDGLVTLRLLVEANEHTPLVKLGIDQDGDVFMNVELPTEGFVYNHFHGALAALSQCADQLIVPLLQAKAIDERNL